MNILVTTMGASWQILPELMGFTNPGLVDLFCNHFDKQKMEQAKRAWGIEPVDEVWIISSCGSQSEKSIQEMSGWYDSLNPGKRPCLRIWKVKDTDSLSSEYECRKMAEAIHMIVCSAFNYSEKGKLMLSLTGGRKTMSTDLQQAAAWFGCNALIHVVDDPEQSRKAGSRKWGINMFLKPLPAEYAGMFTPFCLGSLPGSPLADLLDTTDFIIPLSSKSEPVLYEVPPFFPLTEEIGKLQADAGFLLANYTSKMLQDEKVTNFLALYSMPKNAIEQLKALKFGVDPSREKEELSLLKKLPRAELHCHLGGIATAEELIKIAMAARADIDQYHDLINPWIKKLQPIVATCDSAKIMAEIASLKAVRQAVAGVPEALCTASFILLFHNAPELLHQVMFGAYTDKEKFCGVTFEPYEKIGDLQGSGLLSHPGCLKAACCTLAEKAIEHNVDYLEVRCSPVKYAGPFQSEHNVHKIIAESFSDYADRLKVSLIFTASRHGETEQIQQHITLAGNVLEGEKGEAQVPLRGFDLAGDEKACNAAAMQKYFLPMMEKCMHFTIHAGENHPAESIWEAVYYLNAERIGHGLTLKDNPALMEKIHDRNITLEMCPSSNFQIVGFQDNYFASTQGHTIYPLKHYLDHGISVTINTDNPGISDTDFTRELHRACRLTPEGLSLWEILSIIRNSFKASFAPRALKHDILKKAEKKIVKLLHEIL